MVLVEGNVKRPVCEAGFPGSFSSSELSSSVDKGLMLLAVLAGSLANSSSEYVKRFFVLFDNGEETLFEALGVRTDSSELCGGTETPGERLRVRSGVGGTTIRGVAAA